MLEVAILECDGFRTEARYDRDNQWVMVIAGPVERVNEAVYQMNGCTPTGAASFILTVMEHHVASRFAGISLVRKLDLEHYVHIDQSELKSMSEDEMRSDGMHDDSEK